MKIVSLVKSKSSAQHVTFVTEPKLDDEVSAALDVLREKNPVLQEYELKNEDGLLAIYTTETGKPISFSSEFQEALQDALNAAEESVVLAQLGEEQEKQKAREQKEAAIKNAARSFGVPIIEAVAKPDRK